MATWDTWGGSWLASWLLTWTPEISVGTVYSDKVGDTISYADKSGAAVSYSDKSGAAATPYSDKQGVL